MKNLIALVLFFAVSSVFAQSKIILLETVLDSESVQEFLSDKTESSLVYSFDGKNLLYDQGHFVPNMVPKEYSEIINVEFKERKKGYDILFSVEEVYAKARLRIEDDQVILRTVHMKTKGSEMKSKMLEIEF